MPSSLSTIPKPGHHFKVSEAVFHHYRLRPLIGLVGRIRHVYQKVGLVLVQFPDGGQHHLLLTMGTLIDPSTIDASDPAAAALVQGLDDYAGPARRYGVSLPLPPAECSPNARPSTFAKARAVQTYRSTCCRLYLDAGIPPLRTPVRIDLAFYLCRPFPGTPIRDWGSVYDAKSFAYPRDRDNARACAKAAQDALQDAGIIVADSARNVLSGETHIYTRALEHKGETKLVLSIEEVPGE